MIHITSGFELQCFLFFPAIYTARLYRIQSMCTWPMLCFRVVVTARDVISDASIDVKVTEIFVNKDTIHEAP